MFMQIFQKYSIPSEMFSYTYIMTTPTHSECKVLTYTNELVETILSQLNSSNSYYTPGGNYIIFTQIGSNKILILDYTYLVNRNIFQNYIINENTVNDCQLEFII